MKYKILVVEDNEDIRENTTELLELFNYCVCAANNGKEGLDKALQETPDLILSDIRMPVMDGLSLLERVRRLPTLKNARFIFFSSSSEKKHIEECMRLGADDYIIKPFSADELKGKVKKLLDPGWISVEC
jgi:CRP/FNR family transcriptional regulator, cyclic AMP receptor protein